MPVDGPADPPPSAELNSAADAPLPPAEMAEIPPAESTARLGTAGDTAVSPELPKRVRELLDRIRGSADLLAADRASRGDLKIVVRALEELRGAFRAFAPYRRSRKVTVFGSARTPPTTPAYELGVEFGRRMAAQGWFVITGAASGIMEACHVGAGRERAMGLNILLPFEQLANRVIAGDPKLVNMNYFFTRKLMFVKESDALCLLPGGFGTLDEGFEVLTLLQTGKRDMVPVVMLDEPAGKYWNAMYAFIREQLLGNKMIDAADLSLVKVTHSIDAAIEEILGFYRVYHSMRYVRQRLVLRLLRAPTESQLETLNHEFADLLSRGKFKLSKPLPEEKDETLLAEMPRLVGHFHRRSYGRLRQMIDWINRNV